MPTLTELLSQHGGLAPADVDWLRLLVGDWQLLSDLSFADLVLWIRRVPSGQAAQDPALADATSWDWVAAAHVRPTTGPMVFVRDMVGQVVGAARGVRLSQAYRSTGIARGEEARWRGEVPVREEWIRVVRDGRSLAVISRHTNLATRRTPSDLEVTYREIAESLAAMIADGQFPTRGAATGQRRGAPRVGDGVIRLDADGTVLYASPNAVSAYHRLGSTADLVGRSLAEVTTGLLSGRALIDEGLALVVTGRAPWRTEVESQSSTITLRAIPLIRDGVRTGAMVLLRDVTELRRSERALLTKDATIREIHHRVKNNLQTVAALLRLQSRRLGDAFARGALEEAVRRVGTIALVHEALSQAYDETVDFDQVVVQVLGVATEVASRETQVRTTVSGTFGRLSAEDATALAMILAELVHNAVEHGLGSSGGTVHVDSARQGEDLLTVTVSDTGAGMLEGFDVDRAGGLGTRIVRSLVEDLRGRIEWAPRSGGGTRVRFDAHLRPIAGPAGQE